MDICSRLGELGGVGWKGAWRFLAPVPKGRNAPFDLKSPDWPSDWYCSGRHAGCSLEQPISVFAEYGRIPHRIIRGQSDKPAEADCNRALHQLPLRAHRVERLQQQRTCGTPETADAPVINSRTLVPRRIVTLGAACHPGTIHRLAPG
jgi:hypothetical protein